MKLEGDHLFNGPQQDVWDMFIDPEVLGSALPGGQGVVKVDDTHYDAKMALRVGPVSGNFAATLTLEDVNAPESCTLIVEGRGSAGFVKGKGYIQFLDNGDGTTLMKYLGEANIGGVLASVGQRMIDSVAKAMLKPAFETLDKALAARLAAKAAS